MTWRATLLAVAVLALQAPIAFAGSVSINAGTLTVTAAPGETNRTNVAFADDRNEYIVSDSVPLSAGAGCTQSGRGVTCPGSGIAAVLIDLGDGDDQGDAAGGPAPITMHGGPGNDELDGIGTFFGDEGEDYLVGGDQPDVFSGGPGLDRIEAEREDTIDCQGGGDDVVKPSAKPKLVNCPGAPALSVSTNHVTVKQLLAGKLRLTIRCSTPCAYRFFLKVTAPLKRFLHHSGDNLEARPISLDDGGFLDLAASRTTTAFVNGSSTQRALRRLHRFKLKLVVEAYSGQNVMTSRTIGVQVG